LLIDFCEENLQLSIRNHMNSNRGKFQFHMKPNAKLEQRRINNSTTREKEEPSKKSKYSKPPRL